VKGKKAYEIRIYWSRRGGTDTPGSAQPTGILNSFLTTKKGEKIWATTMDKNWREKLR
jgi:hypothetical protein